MIKLTVKVFIASFLMYAWGSVFWMSPLGSSAMGAIDNESALAQGLNEGLAESGVYFLPDPNSMEENPQEWTTRHQEGPLAMVIYFKGGTQPMDPKLLLKGFIHIFFSVFILAFILERLSDSLKTYKCRFVFIVLVGFLIGFNTRIGDAIWFLHPTDWALMQLIYITVAWAVAGSVLAIQKKSSRTN